MSTLDPLLDPFDFDTFETLDTNFSKIKEIRLPLDETLD